MTYEQWVQEIIDSIVGRHGIQDLDIGAYFTDDELRKEFEQGTPVEIIVDDIYDMMYENRKTY